MFISVPAACFPQIGLTGPYRALVLIGSLVSPNGPPSYVPLGPAQDSLQGSQRCFRFLQSSLGPRGPSSLRFCRHSPQEEAASCVRSLKPQLPSGLRLFLPWQLEDGFLPCSVAGKESASGAWAVRRATSPFGSCLRHISCAPFGARPAISSLRCPKAFWLPSLQPGYVPLAAGGPCAALSRASRFRQNCKLGSVCPS